MANKVKPIPAPIQKGPLEAKDLGKFVRARRTQAGMGIHEAAAFCGVAVDSFDLSQHLIGEEPAFGQRMLDGIRANCQRFLEISKELPGVKL